MTLCVRRYEQPQIRINGLCYVEANTLLDNNTHQICPTLFTTDENEKSAITNDKFLNIIHLSRRIADTEDHQDGDFSIALTSAIVFHYA